MVSTRSRRQVNVIVKTISSFDQAHDRSLNMHMKSEALIIFKRDQLLETLIGVN